MENQKGLDEFGCFFYKVEGTDLQVCITSGKDRKDIAVFKSEKGKVVMLPVESNEFRGERLNRAPWAQLEWLKSFGVNKAVLIDKKDANSMQKKYVTDYLSNH